MHVNVLCKTLVQFLVAVSWNAGEVVRGPGAALTWICLTR